MVNALWITLIGMGLVFFAILLLWGLMVLLVRLTAKREVAEPEPDIPALAADPDLERKRKYRAAAAAVTFAMAMRLADEPEQGVQPTELVTAWQAIHRASQVSQRVIPQGKKVV
jgi:Na+-transporting methylmalonyl-CoA/oxaloacetate decarboxylase gamma subunit